MIQILKKIIEYPINLLSVGGLRKYSLVLLTVCLASYFLKAGLLASADYASLLSGVLVAFCASNSVEHVKSTVSAWKGGSTDVE